MTSHDPSPNDAESTRALPRLIESAAELRAAVAAARARGLRIGLVPTMGALHAGHSSLVEHARRECGFTIATIFVNPTQFGPGEDFTRYPRDLAADLRRLGDVGVDAVFAPVVDAMYPAGHATFVAPAGVAEPLEGAMRPGHFRGVATIVLKLFNLAAPDAAYFGQKDYQQTLVVRQMVRDLDVPVEIRVSPIVREADGLAMSSRNRYLTAADRERALALSRALRTAAQLVRRDERDAATIRAAMLDELAKAGDIQIDYAVVVDPETLAELDRIGPLALAALAVRVGDTRLIDNCLLAPGRGEAAWGEH